MTAKKTVPALKDLGKKDNTPEVEEEEFDRDEDYTDETVGDDFLSPNVTSTIPNKTPAELSSETPEETAQRYGIDTKVTQEDIDNPRVQVYKDTRVVQVPSGTHLHPDIAKDLYNRGIAEMHTDNAMVRHEVVSTYDFAPDAPHNDKFTKPDDEDVNEGADDFVRHDEHDEDNIASNRTGSTEN